MTKRGASQNGQALAEGLVVLLILAAMFTAIAWLYRWQDLALQASHASRALAFEHVRNPKSQEASDVVDQLLRKKHRWNNTQGETLLPHDAVQWRLDQRYFENQTDAFPALAATTWQELGFDADTIATASVQIASDGKNVVRMPVLSLWQLSASDVRASHPVFQLTRSTSILSVSAGHSANHEQVQQRFGQSGSLWRSVVDTSVSLGRKTDVLMRPVDKAWNRPSLSFDWLLPWAGRLPSYLNNTYE